MDHNCLTIPDTLMQTDIQSRHEFRSGPPIDI